MGKTNGTNGWLMKAALTSLFAIAMGITGWVRSEQARAQVKQVEHGERISVLETRQASIDATLDRMDHKLDRVLERITK